MKKSVITITTLFLSFVLIAQSYKPEQVDPDTMESIPMRVIDNSAFQAGEMLKYKIHYGFVDAGEVVLKVENSSYNFGDREAFHIIGTGKSLGGFDWFFKVRDRYETYIDKQGIFPYRFVREVSEGGYEIHQDYTFLPWKKAVKTDAQKTYKTPAFIQDMLSSFYYTRTLDFSNIGSGDTFMIETIIDGEIFPLQIKYIKTENIKIRSGKFRCMKFVPILQEGRVFENEEDLNVWITDDENKIPILVKSKLMVGSIKMEMTEWLGVANSIAIID